MKEKVQKGLVRVYLGYKRALTNIKGSPTMEYIIIIAVGALFAGLLYNVFKGESGENIMQKIESFITNEIDSNLEGGGGEAGGDAGGDDGN